MSKARLRRLEQRRHDAREQAEGRRELEERIALEDKRMREDPEGWDRYLWAQNLLLEAIDDAEREGYDLYGNEPEPESLSEAWQHMCSCYESWTKGEVWEQ